MKKWPVILALILIYLAVLLEWNWVWGVLFIFWTIPSLYSGEVHLVQAVTKKDHPVLYWLIILTWIVLSMILILTDVMFVVGSHS